MASPSSPVANAERRPRRGALSEPAVRGCRALLALAALTAIGYNAAAGPGVSDGDYFSYFTVLSNVFAAAMLLYGALRPVHASSRTVELLRGAAVVYILTTGIVYVLLLSGRAPAYPWVNAILHYLMPVAVRSGLAARPAARAPRSRADGRFVDGVPAAVHRLHIGARRDRGLVSVLLREPAPRRRLSARGR